VTTDGGTKRFSMGSVPPRIVDQEHWSYGFQGDEHGKIIFGNHNDIPEYGAVIKIMPPHCDPTVNLYDFYHVVQDGRLVDIWRIEGRGAF
jgi:3-hydroxy-D-aspartate aldolase